MGRQKINNSAFTKYITPHHNANVLQLSFVDNLTFVNTSVGYLVCQMILYNLWLSVVSQPSCTGKHAQRTSFTMETMFTSQMLWHYNCHIYTVLWYNSKLTVYTCHMNTLQGHSQIHSQFSQLFIQKSSARGCDLSCTG